MNMKRGKRLGKVDREVRTFNPELTPLEDKIKAEISSNRKERIKNVVPSIGLFVRKASYSLSFSEERPDYNERSTNQKVGRATIATIVLAASAITGAALYNSEECQTVSMQDLDAQSPIDAAMKTESLLTSSGNEDMFDFEESVNGYARNGANEFCGVDLEIPQE